MESLQQVVNSLARMKIISENNGRFCSIVHDLHLPEEHNLFRIWSARLKMMSINRSAVLSSDSTYDFSVVFSADQSTYLKIKEKFMQFLQTIRPLVKEAPGENVYQLNFDLLSWTKD